MKPEKYKWYALGDINAFMALSLDNLTPLMLLAVFLIGAFNFPVDVILKYMIPGVACGIFVGDLAFALLAFRLARRTGITDVTAVPMGTDSPTLIGIVFAVMGPLFLKLKGMGMDEHSAAILAWKTGAALTFIIGIIKIGSSYFANFVKSAVPRAGMLGSLAGIGVLLIIFIPFRQIFTNPIPGFVALAIIMLTLTGKIRLRGIPPALLAVMVGTIVYYAMIALGLYSPAHHLDIHMQVALPNPGMGFLDGLPYAMDYLPTMLPFAIVVILGGINVTESANAAGDPYSSRDVVLVDGCATLIASLCGSVIQNTPYIGHPAFKDMGGRAAYIMATAFAVGLLGMFGVITYFIQYIPETVIAPILIFIGIEITVQAFHATPRAEAPAVVMAIVPAIAYLVTVASVEVIKAVAGFYGNFSLPSILDALNKDPNASAMFNVSLIMGNGFMLVGLLWGSTIAFILLRRLYRAASFMILAGLLTLFGVIHSPALDGSLFVPWHVPVGEASILGVRLATMPYHISIAYLFFGLTILAFTFLPSSKVPLPEMD